MLLVKPGREAEVTAVAAAMVGAARRRAVVGGARRRAVVAAVGVARPMGAVARLPSGVGVVHRRAVLGMAPRRAVVAVVLWRLVVAVAQ